MKSVKLKWRNIWTVTLSLIPETLSGNNVSVTMVTRQANPASGHENYVIRDD